MKKACLLIALLTLIISTISCEKNIVNDYKYIKSKGVMKIGITEFPPMNYHDADGNLIGLDTELAETVCAELGVKPEFVEINWELREKELDLKNIDCIWNGTTLTDREKILSITDPYISSKEVLVTKTDRLSEICHSLQGDVISVERGSTGERISLFIQDEISIKLADSQLHALYDVETGAADAAVVDYLMIFGGIGEGTPFADLTIDTHPMSDDEVMVIAFRRGSDLTKKVNKIMEKLKQNGTIKTIAKKYGIEELLIN